MNKLRKTDNQRPPLSPLVLEINDNHEYIPKCNLQYMSQCSTSTKSPEIVERLQHNNESVFHFPHEYNQHNQQKIGPDVDCNYTMCNSMCKSNSIPHKVETKVEKDLNAILREVRIITDKIRHEVR